MNRHDLEPVAVFLAVAERGGFAAAAARLGLTPSAVSQRVRTFEDRLGVRLFDRTTRAVRLTEAGQALRVRAEEALGILGEALDEARGHRLRPSGTLRLSLPRIVADTVIGPRLAGFLAAYPDIQVEITVEDRLVDIVRDGFDAGVRLGETLMKDMVAVRLGPDLEAAIVGSPGYLDRHGRPQAPEDLARHRCILWRRVTRGDVYRWQFDGPDGEVEVPVQGPLTVDDIGLMRQAALDGVGLAYLSDDLVAPDLAAGRLERVLARWCRPYPGYRLYYPSRANPPAKLRALVDFLRLR